VLEIGCGTGQLTRSLLARGLTVTAVEPGEQLITRTRERLEGIGELRFINARLEDASLPGPPYPAAFSASALHWADPDVSWRKLAGALVPGGTLALLSYFGLREPWSDDDQQALRDALGSVAPEVMAGWPVERELEVISAGVADRRANISRAWSWLGDYELGREDAAQLFGEAELTAIPCRFEHTADQLSALLGTMSFWARLSADQREGLVAANRAVHERLGRAIRSSTAACLLTARRRPGRRASPGRPPAAPAPA